MTESLLCGLTSRLVEKNWANILGDKCDDVEYFMNELPWLLRAKRTDNIEKFESNVSMCVCIQEYTSR